MGSSSRELIALSSIPYHKIWDLKKSEAGLHPSLTRDGQLQLKKTDGKSLITA